MRRFGFMLLSALALLTGMRAHAQEPTPDEPHAAEAREAFAEGERAFAQADYAAALEHFRRAFELRPHPAVRFNLAVCLDSLGRFVEAAEQYDAAAGSTELDEQARRQAAESAARMRLRLAVLVVEGEPNGEPVFVDDLQRCVLPCRVQIDPGLHRVRTRAGEAEQIDLRRGETRTLRIEANAAPTEVDLTHPVPPATPSFPTWIGWTGVGVAGLGIAGAVILGLRTLALRSDYETMATDALQSEGLLMRDLTNVSIGVAILGGVLFAVDLLLHLGASDDHTTTHAFDAGAIRF
jgi:hypothetical protein